MPRSYPHSHLSQGELVGFSVKKRPGDAHYFAYFRDRDGKRLERDTGQTGQIKAVECARALIDKEYEIFDPTHEEVVWDDVLARLRVRLATGGIRGTTIGYYEKVLRSLRTVYPESTGPTDITARQAAAFRDKMMTVCKGEKPRSAHYVAGVINGLSALWRKWLVEDLKLATSNPWEKVEPPKADKISVKTMSDDQIQHFFAWITERFGEWPLPNLFLRVKAQTGCRLMDLCSLRSEQLREGRIIFPADLTKGRKERRVPLPTELYDALEAIKGEAYLWQRHPTELKAKLVARNWPSHQLNPEFSPQRLYSWFETLFTDYRIANPDRPRITSHMFRKTAFTKAWAAGIDPRKASIAIGCNVDTMMKHYVQMDEQEVTDEVFMQLNKPRASNTK
jgi:integrase